MTKFNKDGTIKYNHNQGGMTILEQTIASLEKKKAKAGKTIEQCNRLIKELRKKL